MDLNAKITGAWDGSTLKVKASFWGDKVSKSVDMSGGVFIADVKVLDIDDNFYDISIWTHCMINGQKSSDFVDEVWVPSYGIVTELSTNGWNLALQQSSNTWNDKTVGVGKTVTIWVPASDYGTRRPITVTGVSGSGGPSSCCFPAGAPVLLADGTTKPIEQLTVGTIVIGYDQDTNTFCETEVMKTIQKKYRSDIYEVQRADGVSFLMTANHVVLTKEGWKAIDADRGQACVPEEHVTELTNVDELLDKDGNYIKIINIKYRDDLQNQNVYNIDVEEVDTFIAYGIVVHNDIDC